MRFSIFTPTHNPANIRRLAQSLSRQTFKDFEWVVVANKDAKAIDVRNLLATSGCQHIKCIDFDAAGNTGIGSLKKFCCKLASGEFLVEVDHDDELTPNALAELYAAFEPGIDFVYSNWCDVNQDGSPVLYPSEHGWQYRQFEWEGRALAEAVAFPPSPASFSRIWYAPNHVRAWRSSFYNTIMGHDPLLPALDDQDLLCRTYVSGNVRHIDKCLYIQHHHDENSSAGLELNDWIQKGTVGMCDHYLPELVMRWCRDNSLEAIDLCSGPLPAAQFTGIDLLPAPGVIQRDLNCAPWPFPDGSVGVFRASDALEHLRDPLVTMREIYRCLAPNGWLLSDTPSTDGRGAFQDPTHCSFWNANSFLYWTHAEQARFIGTPVKFQEVRKYNYFPSPWHELNNIPYVRANLLKFSGRTPGLVTI